ncbi:MAG: helix-turn-helix domain-containing protein [Bacteroidia bacterium]
MFNENLKYIFGLKVRSLRMDKNFSFSELAAKTGLSVSYLNEIEKGKKYPKGDKIFALAQAFDTTYDELVSLKVNKKLQPLVDLLQSNLFQELPLEMYGLELPKIIELISEYPEKVNAFISTITQMARSYEMRREHFYFAAVRSYQELHDNYFEEIEEAVVQFKKKYGVAKDLPIQTETLQNILKKQFGIKIEKESLPKHKALKNLRSLHLVEKKKLLLNVGISSAQENFLIGRELGFQYLKLKERPLETPMLNAESFDSALNNFKASYFAVALLMDKKEVIKDVRTFSRLQHWDEATFLAFLEKYNATPEMLMQRLTNILPKHFNIKNLFFLRFVGKDNFSEYELDKELHLSRLHNPHKNELGEHYCRRWIALGSIRHLRNLQRIGYTHSRTASVQIEQYWNTPNKYLCLSISFPNISHPQEAISITIGFLMNENLQRMIRFSNDLSEKTFEVHTTCERCPLIDCNERIAPPIKVQEEQEKREMEACLKEILTSE